MAKVDGSEHNSISIRDALAQPEYAKVRVTSAIFGLSRTQLFRLLHEGKITSVHYKQAGARKGVQLINLQSVRNHLQGLVTGK